MKKLFKNLFGNKAQLKGNSKQLFKEFHEISNDSLHIISEMKSDVQILQNLTKEMIELNEKNITIYDDMLEYLDKKIAKQEGISE